MNPFAYRTTGLAIKTLSNLVKARINIHDRENIPEGAVIFVINHFTRIETLLIPYHINRITQIPIWSLASYELFKGAFSTFLENVGAVSTKDPDRDLLIVKSLLTGKANWVIFPEGRMVKNRKIIEKGQFMVSYAGGKHPPHTGAASLALRTEFYRQRLKYLSEKGHEEADRLMDLFQIDSVDQVTGNRTHIIPVNVTYYPIRAKENALSGLASRFLDGLPDRAMEEIMTEGTMLLSGVDIDIRFGPSIDIKKYTGHQAILRDIRSEKAIDFDDLISSRPVMRKKAVKIMQAYMAAIYSMTTVNHDHLFASILRAMPVSKISADNLKKRVYLIAQKGLADSGIHIHNSLGTDQIHLVTDDRYHKFRDFKELAMDTGVVAEKNGLLVKDKAKLSSLFDFHTVRIENPVAVIANEVEPLLKLQRQVRRIAWKPGFWLRRQITDELMKQDTKEYEEDYAEFFVEGETKSKSVGRPFLVEGRSKKIGVVLIHGYMAAPPEVRDLALFLGRMGLWVYVPRLRGHGTSPDDLAIRSYQDWIRSVDRGYAIISNICSNIVVGGFSTGAGLAIDLALRVKDIKGVFAISPPMKLQDLSSRFVPAVDGWNKLMKAVGIEGAQKEFVENQPENPHINYARNPITGIRELERLMDSLEERLQNLEMPALVAQSHRDPVVNEKGSKRIFDLLGSEKKKYVLFNMERHGILLGERAEIVYRAIWNFIEEATLTL